MNFKSLLLSLSFSLSAFAGVPAIDYAGNLLPGNPAIVFSSGIPTSVSVGSVSVRLYAYGTGPAPMTNFGVVKRECSRLVSDHTSCYSTNPRETNLTEDSICGFPAVPALIVSCKASGCVSEIYVHACGAVHPDKPSSAYTFSVSPSLTVGEINSASDFSTQPFRTSGDYVSNLNLALKVKEHGRTPIIAVGSMLFDVQGKMKPDAPTILDAAISRFPSLFSYGTVIEVFDEPFLERNSISNAEKIASINAVSALLKSRIPGVSIGVAIAPVWGSDPDMIPSFEAIVHNLQWVATDPYMQTLGYENVYVEYANQFSDYMRRFHPELKTWLIVQGFAPVLSKKPSEWTITEIESFKKLLNGMYQSSLKYTGVMIWGWNSVNELDDAYNGNNFPDEIKKLYLSVLN